MERRIPASLRSDKVQRILQKLEAAERNIGRENMSMKRILMTAAAVLAIGTIVDSRTGSQNGGLQVSSGGTASSSLINSGGFEIVMSGGTDIGMMIGGIAPAPPASLREAPSP